MLTKSLPLFPALGLALGIVVGHAGPAFADPSGGGGGNNSCTGNGCKVDSPRNPLDPREPVTTPIVVTDGNSCNDCKTDEPRNPLDPRKPVKAPIIVADPNDGGGHNKADAPRNPLDPRVSDSHPVAAVIDLGLGAITLPKPKIIKTDGGGCSQC